MGDKAFGVTSVPGPDNYAGKTFFAGKEWIVGIKPASAFRDEARLFAEFLAERTSFISEKAGAVSGALAHSSDPFYSKLWDISISGEISRDFIGLPWTELEKSFREELSALFAGKLSPAETSAAIQKKWEEVLN